MFTSCSSLLKRSNEMLAKPEPGQFVAKEQYDELNRKYLELLNKSKNNPKVVNELNEKTSQPKVEGQPEFVKETSIDPSELVNQIDQKLPDIKEGNGVDVLAESDKKIGPPLPNTIAENIVVASDDIDEQIQNLRDVQNHIKVNKFENALTLLKSLESSKEKQIVVRAKYMLAELLFNQGEYDLSMQVFEEIVNKYAFSGFVIKSLGKLVACSEKLKLPEKQAKYYSLLHDFFEAG